MDQKTISLEDARELVRKAQFGKHCVELSDEQFELIQLYGVKQKKCPPSVRKKADKAWIVRDMMDEQLRAADNWLRTHGFNFSADEIRTWGNVSIRPVRFDRQALEQTIERKFARAAGDAASKRTVSQSKRGRREKFNWDLIGTEFIRLMDHHDDFIAADPEWNAQARAEEALMAFCREKLGDEPSITQLRGHIRDWLPKWREKKRK
jgi:hypothetical protein